MIPAYNEEDVITDALESVLGQTRKPEQVIVVDDGSRDSTAAVVMDWARRTGSVVDLIRKPNGGLPSARNAGFRRAATEYVALLDSDDLWRPNHLEELERGAVLEPQAVALFGITEVVRADDGAVTKYYPGPLLNAAWDWDAGGYWRSCGPKLYSSLLGGSYIGVSSSLISLRAAEAIGFMDDSMLMIEDLDFWLRLSRNGTFVHVPAVISTKRVDGGNMTSPLNAFQLNRWAFRVLRKALRNRRLLGLSENETRSTSQALRNTVPDLLYSASKKGLKRYCETWLEVVGSGVLLEALSVRHLLRAFAASGAFAGDGSMLGVSR